MDTSYVHSQHSILLGLQLWVVETEEKEMHHLLTDN